MSSDSSDPPAKKARLEGNYSSNCSDVAAPSENNFVSFILLNQTCQPPHTNVFYLEFEMTQVQRKPRSKVMVKISQ